jgi:hypothetical protein
MARRRWGGWASRRACCVQDWAGRARACTQRQVHGLWHHLMRAFAVAGWCPNTRVRERCILRPDSARYHTPG